MARAASTDPLRNFKFRVSFDGNDSINTSGLSTLGFSVVSGLVVQNEMIAYREGGMNTHPHKMVGQSDFGPVTFTKGVFADQDQMYNWQQFIHSWNGGANPGSTNSNNDYRCDITVRVMDHPITQSVNYSQPGDINATTSPDSKVKLAYRLYNCWPASLSFGDLSAGDSSILIQQMVVNHEGFEVVWADSAGGEADAEKLSN